MIAWKDVRGNTLPRIVTLYLGPAATKFRCQATKKPARVTCRLLEQRLIKAGALVNSDSGRGRSSTTGESSASGESHDDGYVTCPSQ